MIRLNITAEGQTEERFIRDALFSHLSPFGVFVNARRVLTGRDKKKSKSYRGGLLSYDKAKKDIISWMKEETSPDARFSTMFDLYSLPGDFPGFGEASRIIDPYQKVALLENAMKEDINDYRFIPYLQLHEFEALVFANPGNLQLEYFDYEDEILELGRQLDSVGGNPELIDEGKETAPSKRIIKLIPEYDKVSVGATIAAIDGIDFLKEKCPHFREWISSLENLTPK